MVSFTLPEWRKMKKFIGQRCKQSGMFWSEAGVQNKLDLRLRPVTRSRVAFGAHPPVRQKPDFALAVGRGGCIDCLFFHERIVHMHFLIGLFTVLLLLVTLFMIMVILMQRPRSDSGLGAALGGGGAAESAFGAETATVLTKTTIYCVIFFFVASFGLYLAHMHVRHAPVSDLRTLPEIRESEPSGAPAVPSVDVAPDQPAENVPATIEEPAEELLPSTPPADAPRDAETP